MFVPAGVSLMLVWSQVKDSVIKYIFTAVVSCIIVMGVSGRATQFIIRRMSAEKEKPEDE